MNQENYSADQKSLRKVTGNTADWPALAADCVCFANAAGGCLRIGIEDGEEYPPAGQRVAVELMDQIRKRIAELTVNVQVAPERVVASNSGEYVALQIARSTGVASTSDGRYFVRVADACKPVIGDEVLVLLNERPSVPWEALTTLRLPVVAADPEKRQALCVALRQSDRVKVNVKEKTDDELFAHYGLSDGDWLTNLGILVASRASDRAKLGTAPSIQAIKFDDSGQKINKWRWDDYSLSPIEMIEVIWQELPDFHESYELPDGLYRGQLPAYDKRVVRELLVNALVHRPYTQRASTK
jgi:ATP-dependent DNA helicase RecG